MALTEDRPERRRDPVAGAAAADSAVDLTQAQTVTVSYSGWPSNGGATTVDWNVPRFDETLGVLDGIDFVISQSGSYSGKPLAGHLPYFVSQIAFQDRRYLYWFLESTTYTTKHSFRSTGHYVVGTVPDEETKDVRAAFRSPYLSEFRTFGSGEVTALKAVSGVNGLSERVSGSLTTTFNIVYHYHEVDDLFTAKRDVVDFNHLSNDALASLDSLWRAGYTYRAYHALDGSDEIHLPDSATVPGAGSFTYDARNTFDAGQGNDRVFSGPLDDRIDGGTTGRPLLKADFERDTVVFDGRYAPARISGNPLTGGAQITVSGPDDGTDTLRNVEFAQFEDATVPLLQWSFVVERSSHGVGLATIRFLENGIQLGQWGGHFDDATPISAGEYAAFYRTSRNRIELRDVSGRVAIQIHGGTNTFYSQGCFVFDLKAFAPVRDYIFDHLRGMSASKIAGVYGYDLPCDITVKVVDTDGQVLQPKITFGADTSIAEGTAAAVPWQFKNTGDDGAISKVLHVALQITGSARFGTDWKFADDTLVATSGAGQTLKPINSLVTESGAGQSVDFWIQSFQHLPDLEIVALSDRISSKSPETVKIRIVDVDLYNPKHKEDGPLELYEASGKGKVTFFDQLFFDRGDIFSVSIIDQARAPSEEQHYLSPAVFFPRAATEDFGTLVHLA